MRGTVRAMNTTTARTSIVVMSLSALGFVGITLDEGYTDKAIPDPVKGVAVPTIGFGTTTGVKMGDTTTPPQALRRALSDIQGYEGALKRCVTAPLYQHEFDAYVDLAYNIGSNAFCKSSIVVHLNRQEYAQACQAILRWRYVGKVDCSAPGNHACPGLWARRLETYHQCMGDAQ